MIARSEGGLIATCSKELFMQFWCDTVLRWDRAGVCYYLSLSLKASPKKNSKTTVVGWRRIFLLVVCEGFL